MTYADTMTGLTWSRRLCRLPLVLLLAVGMLFSLMHCAGCDHAFASGGEATIAAAVDTPHGPTPEKSPSSPVCHSGHCLSPVTAASGALMAQIVEAIPSAPQYGKAQVLTSLAGLALFKPPRV